MKIVHIILGKANPERMNGVNQVVHQLAEAQTKAGIDVSVFGITKNLTHDYPVRSFRTLLFPPFRFNPGKELVEAIAELPADTIVHFHGGFIFSFARIARLLQSKKIAYVITPHGNYMKGAFHKNELLKRIYFKFIERAFLKNAKAVQCLGEGEAYNLTAICSDANIVVIPNGINSNDLDSADTFVHPKQIIGFCGRLSRYHKGLDLLLRGLLLYRKKHPHAPVELWLIGDGEYYDGILQFMLNHNITDNVILWGKRFGKEKNELIASMDAFYHTSRHEGMPMSLLEAASLGVPLVVSEHTNMTGYVKTYESGICLTENSPEEIALSIEQINTYKRNNTLSGIKKNARNMIMEQFQWDIIVNKLNQAYFQ